MSASAVLSFLHSAFHEHADATVGTIIGATTSVAAFNHPAFADWSMLLKVVMPLLSSMMPVAGKAIVQYLKPAGSGLAAGMLSKAKALRARAADESKAGDQKCADQLIERAENLEAEAAAIEAADEE